MGFEGFFVDPKKIHLERKKKLGNIYGSFIGDLPVIVVSDPEMIKTITIKESQNFTDTNPFKLNIKYFKDTFLLKKGKEWKEGRGRVSPVFTTKKIKDIFLQVIYELNSFKSIACSFFKVSLFNINSFKKPPNHFSPILIV